VTELPCLVCRNCAHSILLPVPTHHGIAPNQSSWPTDGTQRNFLCPKCKHVCEYSSGDVQIHLFDGLDPRLTHRGRSVVCVEAPCGMQGCGSPIRILAIMGNDADPNIEGVRLLAQMTVHEIHCLVGHSLTGKRTEGAIFDFGSMGIGIRIRATRD